MQSRFTRSLSLSTKVPLPEEGRPSIPIRGGCTPFETRMTTCSTETRSGIFTSLCNYRFRFRVLEASRHRAFPPISDIGHLLLIVRTIGKSDRTEAPCLVEASCALVRLEAPQFERADPASLCCVD